MRETLRLYFRYLAVSIRSQTEYRLSFLLVAMGQFAATAIEFIGIWALFQRFGTLNGWQLHEAAVLYGLVHVAFALAESIFRGFDQFASLLKSGDFDRLMVRPRSTAFQVMSRELELGRAGRLLQGLVVLLWGLEKLPGGLCFASLVPVGFAILGGIALFGGLFILQATMAFWTIESLEVWNTLTYGGVETAQYPLSIYQPWFRRVFTFLIPLACINYFPVLAILGRDAGSEFTRLGHMLSPLAGFVFLAVSLFIWRFGERKYQSTGN